jgi:hypothetical protein
MSLSLSPSVLCVVKWWRNRFLKVRPDHETEQATVQKYFFEPSDAVSNGNDDVDIHMYIPIFEVRKSAMLDNSVFSPRMENGLFAKCDVAAGTTIQWEFSTDNNDPMIDLRLVCSATNSREMFDAMASLRANYYSCQENLNKINVCLRRTVLQHSCTLRDIAMGEELVRMYGFEYWMIHIGFNLHILTRETLPGYILWIAQHGHDACEPHPRDCKLYYARFVNAVQVQGSAWLGHLYDTDPIVCPDAFDVFYAAGSTGNFYPRHEQCPDDHILKHLKFSDTQFEALDDGTTDI